jgi:hypothetical protein
MEVSATRDAAQLHHHVHARMTLGRRGSITVDVRDMLVWLWAVRAAGV